MIEIARHIEILLLANDCVIVPELGGFVAHHQEARYEPEEHLFLPPLRSIGFNPQLKLNDSLLALSYTETYDISYPEAMRRIESEVDELRQRIVTEGSFELNGIGVLSLNEEGGYLFEPCEAGILTPELYGLGSYEMRPLVEEETAPETEDTSRDAVVVRMSWIRTAVATAAAIIAFFLMTTPVSNGLGISNPQAVNKMEFSVLPTFTKTTAPEVDETTTETETAETADVQEAAQDVSEPEPPKEPSKSFCIVLASQVSQANAEDFVKRLHREGHTLSRVYLSNNIRRVVYGNYQTEQEAINELRAIRGNKNFEEAWVLEVKPQ